VDVSIVLVKATHVMVAIQTISFLIMGHVYVKKNSIKMEMIVRLVYHIVKNVMQQYV
jgi:hypothetical protein